MNLVDLKAHLFNYTLTPQYRIEWEVQRHHGDIPVPPSARDVCRHITQAVENPALAARLIFSAGLEAMWLIGLDGAVLDEMWQAVTQGPSPTDWAVRFLDGCRERESWYPALITTFAILAGYYRLQ